MSGKIEAYFDAWMALFDEMRRPRCSVTRSAGGLDGTHVLAVDLGSPAMAATSKAPGVTSSARGNLESSWRAPCVRP